MQLSIFHTLYNPQPKLDHIRKLLAVCSPELAYDVQYLGNGEYSIKHLDLVCDEVYCDISFWLFNEFEFSNFWEIREHELFDMQTRYFIDIKSPYYEKTKN
jgi:hypothetical protein